MANSGKLNELLDHARQIATYAYAPYSHFAVGAALLSATGQVITGVNVENRSYGLTLCAERSAIANAINLNIKDITAIAVWASKGPNGHVTPCGACRQVLAEFCSPDTPIVMADPDRTEALLIQPLKTLLPLGFTLAE